MDNIQNLYFMSDVFNGTKSGPYLTSSLPKLMDFQHQRFAAFCGAIHNDCCVHRKLWEFAFIHEMLDRGEKLRPGCRGVGFGVGIEPLPSLFASLGCDILATDAPHGIAHGDWDELQHSQKIMDLYKPNIIDQTRFQESVRFAQCDMNQIGPDIKDFDFCWSSSSLEHLGSLDHGINFIERSVEALKIGGIAVHTTEINLSSNIDKYETLEMSYFRRVDIERLSEKMTSLGHEVWPLVFEIGETPADHYVDSMPFSHDRHMKILLGNIVSTSIGIVIRRGVDRGHQHQGEEQDSGLDAD